MTAVKWLSVIVLTTLFAIVGLGIYAIGQSERYVHQLLETEGAKYFGASVTVDAVDLRWSEARGTLLGVEIGNPAGYRMHGRTALRIASVEFELDPRRSGPSVLAFNWVMIERLELDAVIRAPGSSTVHTLLQNLRDARVRADLAHGEDRQVLAVTVDDLVMTNVDAVLTGELSRRRVEVAFSDMHLTELGYGPEGARIDAVLRETVEPLAAAIDESASSHSLAWRVNAAGCVSVLAAAF